MNRIFLFVWLGLMSHGGAFYHGIKSKDTLINQLYPGEQDYIAHFHEVLPAFKDHRYITVDGKPLFMVYHPLDHPEMKEFIELWRTLAVQNGLKGVYFIGQTYHLKEERETYENGV